MINSATERLRGLFKPDDARPDSARRWRRRVPVLRQLNAVECGAACLAMIQSYWGRKTSVAECRRQCGVGRDGLTALAIAKAARECGLVVKAFKAESSRIGTLPMPLVAHWESKHFVVVESWSKKGVSVVDPGSGRRRLTPEEFDAGFAGVALTFEPGERFERRSKSGSASWAAYLKAMFSAGGAKRALALILVASLALQVFGLTLPLLTKVLVDGLIPQRAPDAVNLLGLGMIVVVLAQLSVAYARSRLMLYLRARLDWRVMHDFFRHLLSLPFEFFQRRTGGDILMRLGSNGFIRETLTNQTLSLFLDGTLVVVYLLVLWSQSLEFTLLVSILCVVQLLIVLGTRARLRELMDGELAAKSGEQSYVVEAVNGIATIKASGAEGRVLEHWSGLFSNQLDVSLRRGRLSAFIEMASGGLRVLSPMLLLWYGAGEVIAGRMSMGTMLALNALGVALLSPLSALIGSAQQLQLVGANLDRIMDVLEAEPEQSAAHAATPHRLAGRIEFRNVAFRYSPDSEEVLRDISLDVGRGQKVALVGRTGSGKSTLAMLLVGLFRPTSGEILYDGVPLGDLDFRELRTQLGVVLQEPFLFSGSIRENITLGNPGASFDEVVRAAAVAGVHEEVALMPMGYETVVAEGGTTLSGGQRQRLAIARALAQGPTVLLLDEATSHLDAATERVVDANLSALSCTRIVIAHRMSTVSNADLILVLDGGRIVEQGSHYELLARGGHYAALLRGQEQEV